MCFVVTLVVLRNINNILLLDFRFPGYHVRCRHFEGAFFEEVQLYHSCNKLESLDIIMCESNADEVS
jgi:hypothetical protein